MSLPFWLSDRVGRGHSESDIDKTRLTLRLQHAGRYVSAHPHTVCDTLSICQSAHHCLLTGPARDTSTSIASRTWLCRQNTKADIDTALLQLYTLEHGLTADGRIESPTGKSDDG